MTGMHAKQLWIWSAAASLCEVLAPLLSGGRSVLNRRRLCRRWWRPDLLFPRLRRGRVRRRASRLRRDPGLPGLYLQCASGPWLQALGAGSGRAATGWRWPVDERALALRLGDNVPERAETG